MNKLRITEIFYSLQGETRTVGLPTVFIRLTGCPLRCSYCDTAYAFSGGQWFDINEICDIVKNYKTRYVTVTGGEPLAQKACHDLLKVLCDQGYTVSLETSGALDVSHVDPRVIKVIDIKTPGSKEAAKNNFENISYLLPADQIKFVICDKADYEWSKQIMEQYRLIDRCEVLFSPCFEVQSATELANWIIEDKLPIRYQIQLHKILWGNEPGR